MKPNEENGWIIPKPQKKADLGSLVHKALELLAIKKLAIQDGSTSFGDPEIGATWETDQFSIDDSIEVAWRHYSTTLTHWEWSQKDYKQCRKWVLDTLDYNNGLFNPLNRQVIWPEKHFEYTFDQPWACYSYLLEDGTKLEGQLGLKGTIDLVCRTDEDPEIVELCDWKSGQRKDWATGKPKDYAKLRTDPQLRMYHWALSKLCPWAKEIIITIVFIRDGGPFSLPFSRDDIPETESMIRERFEEIRDCQLPSRIMNKSGERWKCERLCTYFQNKWEQTGQTVCDYLHKEILTIGLDKVTARYGDKKALVSYGAGGGQSSHEEKP